jgi:hypothetical protein
MANSERRRQDLETTKKDLKIKKKGPQTTHIMSEARKEELRRRLESDEAREKAAEAADIEERGVLVSVRSMYSRWYTKIVFVRRARASYSHKDYKNAAEVMLSAFEPGQLVATDTTINHDINDFRPITRELVTKAREILSRGEAVYTEALALYKEGVAAEKESKGAGQKKFQLSCIVMFRHYNDTNLITISRAVKAVAADLNKECATIERTIAVLKKDIGDIIKEIEELPGME